MHLCVVWIGFMIVWTTAELNSTTQHDCKTKEVWIEEKQKWCCENENLGCPYNCLTKEVWTEEKQKWCCENENLGCPYNCKTREVWTEEKQKWCCKNEKLGCADQCQLGQSVSYPPHGGVVTGTECRNTIDCPVGDVCWERSCCILPNGPSCDVVTEEFNSCGPSCPLVCGKDIIMCIKSCNSGCFCKIGYIRSKEGKCITQEECEVIIGVSTCDTTTEIYQDCGSACPEVCGQEPPSFCTLNCVQGCFCKPGLIKSPYGGCLTLTQCEVLLKKNETQFCPADVKECPNSKRVVKRVPPECNFEPCDECGGCQAHEKCVDTGVRCVQAPCPGVYECQADKCFDWTWPPEGINFCTNSTDCLTDEVCSGCTPSQCNCNEGEPGSCTRDCRHTCKVALGNSCSSDDDCATGHKCKNQVCQDPCEDWQWPPPGRRNCKEDNDCNKNEVCQGCQSSSCNCQNGEPYMCTEDCGLFCQLKENFICESTSIKRKSDCSSGLVCLPSKIDDISTCQIDRCVDWSWPPSGTRMCANDRDCNANETCTGCISGACSCLNGKANICTMDCRTTCKLKKDAVCYSEGVINRKNDCSNGLVCSSSQSILNGDLICRDLCDEFQWPPFGVVLCTADSDCASGEVCGNTMEGGCIPSACSCLNGQANICTMDCRQICVLGKGSICKSGGIESGPGISRSQDCNAGLDCKPRQGEIAIGGEVTYTCQDSCKGLWPPAGVQFCDASGNCNEGFICQKEGCLPSQCSCENDMLDKCIQNCHPICKLEENSVCRTSDMCADGLTCALSNTTSIDLTCQNLCDGFEWPPPDLRHCSTDTDCNSSEICTGCSPMECWCKNGQKTCTKKCRPVCQLNNLCEDFLYPPNDLKFCSSATECKNGQTCGGCHPSTCTCRNGDVICTKDCRTICLLPKGSPCIPGTEYCSLGLKCIKGSESYTCGDPCAGVWPPRLEFCNATKDNVCPSGYVCQGCTPSECKCVDGQITSCTKDCIGSCYLAEGSICKSGGVETGPGIDRENDCADGLECRGEEGQMAIGGEVVKKCQQIDLCSHWTWPPRKFCSERLPCTQPGEVCWETCTPSQCDCEDGRPNKCTEDCRNTCVLRHGAVCKSGGIETGLIISLMEDCRPGLVCKPQEDTIAIGGEVDWTCQDMCEGFHWPPVGVDYCTDDTDCVHGEKCEGCKPSKCECHDGNIECSRDCRTICRLGLDQTCKSGGVETGLGISRVNDCAQGLVCKEIKYGTAIGGEVRWTCQDTCPQDFDWPPSGTKFCSSNDECATDEECGGCIPSNCTCSFGVVDCSEDCLTACKSKPTCCPKGPPPCPSDVPNCHWEGIFCCSDGEWYPSIGAGADATCKAAKLKASNPCLDCSTVRCAAPNCFPDEIAYTPIGQCCEQCRTKCSLVKCSAPECLKGVVPVRPDGSCCEVCPVVDCSDSFCLQQQCASDERKYTLMDSCCPKCLSEADCSQVGCTDSNCPVTYLCGDLLCRPSQKNLQSLDVSGVSVPWTCRRTCCSTPPPVCDQPNCYREGIFCCSDGGWYRSNGAGAKATCKQYGWKLSEICNDECSLVDCMPISCGQNEEEHTPPSRCCPECRNISHCELVDCLPIRCAPGYEIYTPDNSCCPICREIDCQYVICSEPNCISSQKIAILPGDCCPTCVVAPVNCSSVSCLAPECADDEEFVTPDGYCCPVCEPKKLHDCTTKELWSPEKKKWCCVNENRGCELPACGGFGGIPCDKGFHCLIDYSNCVADCIGVCVENICDHHHNNCEQCLDAGCVMFGTSEDCTDMCPMDVPCYSGESGTTCIVRFFHIEKAKKCFSKTDDGCKACTDSKCLWIIDGPNGEGECISTRDPFRNPNQIIDDVASCPPREKNCDHHKNNCEQCLDAGCVMFGTSEDCTDMCPMDVACYSGGSGATCIDREAQINKTKECFSKTADGCKACTERDCLWMIDGGRGEGQCISTRNPLINPNQIVDDVKSCPPREKNCDHHHNNCEQCLDAGCVMFDTSEDCTDVCPTDVACYSRGIGATCIDREAQIEKTKECYSKTDDGCKACTESDCFWIIDGPKGEGWCISTRNPNGNPNDLVDDVKSCPHGLISVKMKLRIVLKQEITSNDEKILREGIKKVILGRLEKANIDVSNALIEIIFKVQGANRRLLVVSLDVQISINFPENYDANDIQSVSSTMSSSLVPGSDEISSFTRDLRESNPMFAQLTTTVLSQPESIRETFPTSSPTIQNSTNGPTRSKYNTKSPTPFLISDAATTSPGLLMFILFLSLFQC